MQIIRYLNGVPLSGAMPPLVLPFSLPHQHVPLPPRARSAILKAEDRAYEVENKVVYCLFNNYINTGHTLHCDGADHVENPGGSN